MGRRPCCAKVGIKRGAWTVLEDKILSNYIEIHGEGKWRDLPQRAGLKRCGKSCRLRWMNYLRSDIKRGNISIEEEELIIKLHNLLDNRCIEMKLWAYSEPAFSLWNHLEASKALAIDKFKRPLVPK